MVDLHFPKHELKGSEKGIIRGEGAKLNIIEHI